MVKPSTAPLSERRLLSVIETAEYLGTSRSALLAVQKTVTGHPQSVRHPGRKTTVFDRRELDDWIDSIKRQSRGSVGVVSAIVRTRNSSNETPEKAFASLKAGLPKGHKLSYLPSTNGTHFCSIEWPDKPGKVPALEAALPACEADAFTIFMLSTSTNNADPLP